MAQLDPKYQPYYQAAADTDVVVKGKPGFLHAIILGKYVSGGILEVSDHATDGDGNVTVYLTSGTTDVSCPKTIIVDLEFKVGITADVTNYTNVTFVYR